MDEIIEFFEQMEEIMLETPEIYLKIEKLRANGWWRIHVFGKGLATVGDAELLFAENADRRKAFELAMARIEQMKTNIKNLKEKKK